SAGIFARRRVLEGVSHPKREPLAGIAQSGRGARDDLVTQVTVEQFQIFRELVVRFKGDPACDSIRELNRVAAECGDIEPRCKIISADKAEPQVGLAVACWDIESLVRM